MKKKVLLVIGIILLFTASIYFIKSKPSVNEIIDKSISQLEREEATKTEDTETETEEDNIEVKATEKDEAVTEQIKDLVTDTVKQTFELFRKNEIKITAIGDSLTKGVGDQTNGGGYIGILDKKINHDKMIAEFDNFGKTGNRSDQLLTRLSEPDITASIAQSDIVLITIGANDIMQVVKENITNLIYPKFAEERAEFELRLIEIIETVQDINPNTHIYVLGLYNPFEKYFPDVDELDLIVEEWNRTSKSTTEDYQNTTFIPIKDLFDDHDEDLFADDNFHPNNNGYQLMADQVLEFLTDKER